MIFSDPMTLLISLPIVMGLLCFFAPDKLKLLVKAVSSMTALAAFVGAIWVFIKKPMYGPASYPSYLVADNLSGFIALAVGLFGLLITVYSLGFIKDSVGKYFGYILMTLGSSFGVLFANDFRILIVFWGAIAAFLYLLVNMQGTDASAKAAKKAFVIVGGTDAIMIAGIGLAWAMGGTFLMKGLSIPLDSTLSYLAYFSIAIAAFAKAGVMPFHTWLPDVAESGPTPVTAYLPASIDKLLGIYLLARASSDIFITNAASNAVLSFVGAVTIIVAVVMALVQHDVNRLLGYHAVSQVGYMVLGIGTGNPVGIAGGLFHMLNNAIYKSCLFLGSGAVKSRTLTADLDRLGGLAKYMPITFACFLVASLSISGIPPFNGFVSKWMIYQGVIESAGKSSSLWIIWLSAAMFGSALTIASFMKLLHAIFLGRQFGDFANIKEVGISMWMPMVILASLCALFGVFAFLLPLPMLIGPATSIDMGYFGIWKPIPATALILIGIILGALAYKILSPRKFRTVSTFVGGETPDSMERISGTDFYNTIKDIKGFGIIYKKEEDGQLDIYNIGRRILTILTRLLRYIHNGVLPTYMVWGILGMVIMFFVLFFK